MESTSTIYTSPSFNTNPSTDIADIADRVVQELRSENGFGDDDVFSFSDDDNNPPEISGDNDNPPEIGSDGEVNSFNRREIVKQNEKIEVTDEDEHEFEFPVVCRDANTSPVSSDEIVCDDHISLRYPVFDRSLLSEGVMNCSDGVDSPVTESTAAPANPATRPSLQKLFSLDRDSPSTSSSEADDLDGVTPGTYCVWKPKAEPRGKHKKSNSISIGNTSKRWKVRDLLKRSYSDDSYSTGKDSPVVVFIPPISPKQKINNNEKVNKIERTGRVPSSTGGGGGGGGGGGVVFTKTERNIPAYKAKIGNIRLPPYLPYRQDQVAAFANHTGSSTNLYRY